MLPKLLDVPISTYFMVLAKIRRPSIDAVGEHVEVFFQQDHVGGVLGHVGGGVDRDADVGGVQREGVVDPVAEERHIRAGAPLRPHDRGPCAPG